MSSNKLNSRLNSKLSSVTVFDLGSSNLLTISKFVRLARIEEGVNLRLNDESIICKVLELGERTSNPKLIKLYKNLKVSIARHLENGSTDKKNNRISSKSKLDSFLDIA